MNHFILINLFIFLFVIARNITQASREFTQQLFGQKIICWLFSSNYIVHVINDLPSNSELRLHCASQDYDLGYHTLSVGDDYNWSFCDILHVTVFVCHLWWDLNSKELAFEAFQAHVRANSCFESGECFWSARGDGIYSSGYRDSHDYKVTYFWDDMLPS
ncbi:hypothetical protein ACS0TY_003091 [Phlomoides rotata]